MSNIVNKKLSIDKNNIEQYCDAQNVSFNVSDHAWRKWLNGSTDGYVILKSEGKAALYPTDTARPFKADSLISASRSAGTCTVDLQFAGTNVHSESYTSGTQKQKSKTDITDSAVTNSTKATEIKWHVYGKNGDNQRGDLIELTLYFNQYSAQALIGNGANGVQSVSVSNFAPYYGDTITFGVKLVQGATFDGWYSDSACTQLVSTDTTYSIAPTADVTLYAKATTDATLYNVSAVAGSEITSVNVSDSIVPEGGTATFAAQANTECSFEAWYSDDTYTTVVSTENPYTATITADITLYAKAHRNELHMSVGTAEHGTASVNAATIPYGSDATFTFTPEDETWELYGWYSDAGLTQLVSEANPYTFVATEDVTLYPKVGAKRYTITLKRNQYIGSGITHHLTIASLYEDQLTDTEREYIKTGEFSKIDQAKIFDITTVDGNDMTSAITATLKAPKNLLFVLYSKISSLVSTGYYLTGFALNKDPGLGTNEMQDKVTDPSVICPWNYYSFYPKASDTYYIVVGYTCDCFAIAKDGVAKTTVPTHVMQYAKAPFSAELSPGYTFAGWYSDDACTQLVSTDNPAQITCPAYTGDSVSSTSLTLYAKATKATYTIGVGESDYCITSVSATTAQYGDIVTFECVPSMHYSFKGWYADERLKQLVSEAASYEHTVTDSVILYPRIDCTVRIGTRYDQGGAKGYCVKTAILDFDMLTQTEIECLKTGNYEAIDANKVYEIRDETGLGEADSNGNRKFVNISCPVSKTCAVFGYLPNGYIAYLEVDNNTTYWPYKWFTPCKSFTAIYVYYSIDSVVIFPCDCTAIPGDGITRADATTPTAQGKNAVFTAEIETGHKFEGWYSDEACTQLVSSNNPAQITTPESTEKPHKATSLTLYAKAIAGDYYNCTAVAKKYISSVSVSDPQTASGEQCTFTAAANPGAKFIGWYSDKACTQLVSTENPYATAISSDTILYAKGERMLYTISVDAVAHCNSLASPSTAYYDDLVEFQCTPDAGYEFVGWYFNEARTDGSRISTSNSVSYQLSTWVELYEAINGHPLEGTEFKLWPKVSKIGATSSGLSLKLNGSWVEAKTVYRKVDGVWTEALDECKSVLSQKDRVGTIVQIV